MLRKLQLRVNEIKADACADDTSGKLATRLEPLLTGESVAATRREQMLAFFPGTNESVAPDTAATTDKASTEAPQ